jgi:hypothetical protein
MFIIASTGRCGTAALCNGLDRFSDHDVAHEPPPRLLHEAWLKHIQREYMTPVLRKQLQVFRSRSGTRYGQSIRASSLLSDIRAVAPAAPVLVVVREPLSYVRSAHARGVLAKHNEWDATRIMPLDGRADPGRAPVAERIAWHWIEVNRYLLDFAEHADGPCKVVLLECLEGACHGWSDFLGVNVTDRSGLDAYLRTRPNASAEHRLPDGYDVQRLSALCEGTWARAIRLAEGR